MRLRKGRPFVRTVQICLIRNVTKQEITSQQAGRHEPEKGEMWKNSGFSASPIQ